MNIVFIIESLGSGGAERQLVGLAVLLKNRGYNVTVVSYIEKQFYEDYLQENGVPYVLEKSLIHRVTRPYRIARLLKKLQADVVVSYLTHVNQFVCIARLFYKFKLIVSERSHTDFNDLKSRISYNFYRFADYIVPNSYSEAENILAHFPKYKQKIRVIPNFVDTFSFAPDPFSQQNGSVTQLLSVGRFDKYKNTIPFLHSISDLVSKGYRIHLRWYGNMQNEDYVSEVKKTIVELNLNDSVTLYNQTHNIIKEYQQADIFCLPSILEGYPNVLVEAMSCGLPIVCSNVCEMPLIIKDGFNGYLFDPYDVSSMTKTVQRMLDTPLEERQRMSRNNRDYVVSNNSQNVFVKKYIDLF